MKRKGKSFKTMKLQWAFVIAVLSGIVSLSFGGLMLKVANELFELLNKKSPSDLKDWAILGVIAFYGFIAYGFAILFQLSHKRIIDYFYEK